jgi:ABC-type multidrug transport system fused ATPase/permease subunit
MKFLYPVLLLLGVCSGVELYQDLILEKIFEKYNPQSLPSNDPLKVQVAFQLTGIMEVNTVQSYVVLAGSFKQWWHDERLAWNPEDFGGVESTTLNTRIDNGSPSIWLPDLKIYERSTQTIEYISAQAQSNGDIYWSQLGQFKINANFKMNHYPFDTQEIKMTLESWSHPKNFLFLEPYSGHQHEALYVKHDGFISHIEWELDETKTQIFDTVYDSGEYSTMVFSVKFKREGKTIEKTVVIPAILLSLIAFLYYLFPLGKGIRVPYISASILAMIMFLVILSSHIPSAKDTRGLVDICYCMMIMLFAIQIVVIVLDWMYTRAVSYQKILDKEQQKEKYREEQINQFSSIVRSIIRMEAEDENDIKPFKEEREKKSLLFKLTPKIKTIKRIDSLFFVLSSLGFIIYVIIAFIHFYKF